MPKYDSLRKKERNEKILLLHENRPDLSYKEIGEIFQLTPQRVGQIIKGSSKLGDVPQAGKKPIECLGST